MDAGRTTPQGQASLVMAAGMNGRLRREHGLAFCPGCLAEGMPHYRRAWRLAFVVACPTHGIALRDACPRCAKLIAPHRTPVGRIGRCHACDADLAAPAAAIPPDGPTMALQCLLEARLGDGCVDDGFSPFGGPGAFQTLRALVSATTQRDTRRRLAGALDFDLATPAPGRLMFEQARIALRAEWLGLIARWTMRWPEGFVDTARSAGITQRRFARRRTSPELDRALSMLKRGHPKTRPGWSSILDDATMRRLKRTDLPAWRRLHARRLLAGHAVGPETP